MCRMFAPFAFALTALVSAAALAQPAVSPVAPPTQEAPPAVAVASRSITLNDAIQAALEFNPTLSAARREIEAAEGALTQAGVYQNPTLNMGVEDLRTRNRTVSTSLSQPIELGGKRQARITAAERALDGARVQREGREIQLRADVTQAFLAALLSQERVRLAEASLEIAKSGSLAASRRVQAGKVSPLEETRSKVAEANVRLELVQAQGELRTQLQELRALTTATVPFDALNGDALSLPILPTIEALQLRAEDSATLRQARIETRRLSALADLELAKRTPDVTISAGFQRARQDGQGSNTIATLGVSIPIPVFDTNRGNIVQALRLRDKSEDDARALELRLRADLSIARQRLTIASTEVTAVQGEILPAAQTAFDAAARGFELGKFQYLDVLDAQRTLLQARAQYLRSLGDAHRAVADVARVLGTSSTQP
ncbi:TolC family protein [Pseudorhodoferax soli]|uniref:Cobalt-zinc-cadmium efflux system outer membrane protein n=1 Tax=Pseudorhodoferax soli TaxID=545864 RepID=A0A368XDZ4_9BURK|nr:TolC family protein [Pseudorhodoferax soli]RCW66095.1 cobalt-zinc-cadmium efflux system outer membrane protein [Pseudorhodoferax soli]